MIKKIKFSFILLLFNYIHAQGSLDSLQFKYLEDIFTKLEDPLSATQVFFQSLESLRQFSLRNQLRLERLSRCECHHQRS